VSAASLDDLRSAFAELTALHGWAPLQTPRSLLLALTGRVGAVASLVQWQPETGPDAVTPELRDELADCLVYLVALSDALGVDLVDDAVTKLRGAVENSAAQPLLQEDRT
jgi:NTP pyrophosphatase (non-canonical NTP hydrolase)